jgi:hypothetical protein
VEQQLDYGRISSIGGVREVAWVEVKSCGRCGESWPNSVDFYQKPNDKNCKACKYEVKKAQHDRDPSRSKSPEERAKAAEKQRRRWKRLKGDPVWKAKMAERQRRKRYQKKVQSMLGTG